MLQLDIRAEARALLDRYERRDLASWQFSRALLTYREEGPSEKATRLLRRAYELNSFFQLLTLDPADIEIDGSLPDSDLGYFDEAVEYGNRFHPLWSDDPAALTWMARAIELDG